MKRGVLALTWRRWNLFYFQAVPRSGAFPDRLSRRQAARAGEGGDIEPAWGYGGAPRCLPLREKSFREGDSGETDLSPRR
jgi:hypothetical protein